MLTGLRSVGAEARSTDLYAEGFDPLFSAEERATHRIPGIDPSLRRYADDLAWCDTLILVYPTWWSGQPAMLKGWIDRVWVNGVAWTFPDGANRLQPGLRNVRQLVVVTTHGSTKWINVIEGEGGKRTVTRSLRAMCNPRARTTWLALYAIDSSTANDRKRFLDRVERHIARLAR